MAGHWSRFAGECPDQACESPLVNNKSIDLGEQYLIEIDCAVAMKAEQFGRNFRGRGKQNSDLGRRYSRKRGRELRRPDETAGEHNGERRSSERCLTDMPDAIGQEHPSTPRCEHRQRLFQPIEKPFSIETQSGEVIIAIVYPASFRAEVTSLPREGELDSCVMILITGCATNRSKSRTRF